eukprot:TRINITY_DN2695_c0_g1_i1.p1 TRINITY_DN2695_c0_g1~~TRINITY_DN2695_c0_g1_i1.p1  ORF type:complete len:497 (+),score=69.17 TRINITY_DN2695_c0_g1_i1:274-1764(+)
MDMKRDRSRPQPITTTAATLNSPPASPTPAPTPSTSPSPSPFPSPSGPPTHSMRSCRSPCSLSTSMSASASVSPSTSSSSTASTASTSSSVCKRFVLRWCISHLEALPPEIWAKVFYYLSSSSTRCKLASKFFYNLYWDHIHTFTFTLSTSFREMNSTFSNAARLKRLKLKNTTSRTFPYILSLADRLSCLEIDCRAINLSDLCLIRFLTSLKSLTLHNCNMQENRNLQFLYSLQELTEFSFCHSYPSISDQALVSLPKLTNLTSLCLDSLNNISSTGLTYVSSLLSLETLALHCQRLADGDLAVLTGLQRLRSITLHSAYHFSDLTMQILTSFSLLTSLHITGLNEYSCITHEGIQLLEHLKLTHFSIDAKIGEVELSSLCHLKSLIYLSFYTCGSENRSVLRLLSRIGTLRSLCLKPLTNLDLFHISKISQLTELSLIHTRLITDEGLRHLRALPTLHHLNISNSDKCTRAVAEMRAVGLVRVSHDPCVVCGER